MNALLVILFVIWNEYHDVVQIAVQCITQLIDRESCYCLVVLHSINKTFAYAVAVYQLICTYAMFGMVCPERVVIYHNITYLIL